MRLNFEELDYQRTALGELIWHQRELVPNGTLLSEDARCRYCHEDFFALARGDGFDPADPGRLFDAILLDIDHTPDALLNPSHADLYMDNNLAYTFCETQCT